MRQPKLGGDVLKRARQLHRASICTRVQGQIVQNTLARRADVALLQPGSQCHDLPRKSRHERFTGFGALAERRKEQLTIEDISA